MTCYAQHFLPGIVDTNTNTCCKANTVDLVIDIREIKATVIRGTVTCAKASEAIDDFPLIVARNTATNEVFYAIANQNGTYEVLVTPGTYEVAAFPRCNWYNTTPESCRLCGGCPAPAIE